MANNATAQKRKRDASDQPAAVGTATDRARRGGPKRVATKAGAVLASNDTSAQGTEVDDPSGTGENDPQRSTAALLEFGAMTQRPNNELASQRTAASEPTDPASTAVAALAGIYPTMTVPQPTDLTFANSTVGTENDRNLDPSFGMGDQEGDASAQPDDSFDANGSTNPGQLVHMPMNAPRKPAVGTDEWHRVRKDNHKEGKSKLGSPFGSSHAPCWADPGGVVERRRRETINEGINELAKIVPGCEKNKGSILQRAVSFITQLRENETQNIEKWTLEKPSRSKPSLS